MRILIIGGSGRTGKLVIEEALERGDNFDLCMRVEVNTLSGHTITALVRDPNSLRSKIGLTVVKGIHDGP